MIQALGAFMVILLMLAAFIFGHLCGFCCGRRNYEKELLKLNPDVEFKENK